MAQDTRKKMIINEVDYPILDNRDVILYWGTRIIMVRRKLSFAYIIDFINVLILQNMVV